MNVPGVAEYQTINGMLVPVPPSANACSTGLTSAVGGLGGTTGLLVAGGLAAAALAIGGFFLFRK